MLFEIDAGKMSESEKKLLNIIRHYQRGLERCFEKQDEAKMLHKLERLNELPIKLCHLEETLVGQTVNSLRILGGPVGEVAKSLVEKWQEIVIQNLDEEASDHESQNDSRILTNEDGQSSNTESETESSESSKSESRSRSNSRERKQKQINEKMSPGNNYESCSELKNISKYSGKDCAVDKQKTVESEERLLKAIRRYQRGLEKYLLKRDDSKMLQNLGRLNKIPIEVCHLEKTLVGHTVNNLRILGGEVGMAAKSLVEKWQGTVVHAIENEDSENEDCDVHELRESKNASHINTDDKQTSETEKSSSERHENLHVFLEDIRSSESEGQNQTISHEKKHEEGNEKNSHCSSQQNADDHKVKENGCGENVDALKKNQMERKDLNSNIYIDHHENGTESEEKSKDSIGNNRSKFENHKSKKNSKHESKDKKKHEHKSNHHSKQKIHKNRITDKKKNDSSERDKGKQKDKKERESKDQKESKNKKSVQSDKSSKRKRLISSSSNTTTSYNNTTRSITTGSTTTSSNKTSINTSITNKSSNTTTSSSITCSNDEKRENFKIKLAPHTANIHGVGSGSGFSFEDALGMLTGPPPIKKKKIQVKT